MEVPLVDVRLLLSRLSTELAGLSVSECGGADLSVLLRDVRGAQRCLDGLVMRIGARSNELAADASAEEALRGEGDVGSRQARRESARSHVAEQIDGLGDAASEGRTTGEHIDSIARHTAKLSDEERALLDFDDLVDRATRMLPESFDRYLKRLVDAAKADHGLGDTAAKQAASQFRHWVDQATGMGRFSGSLDPERYELLTGAIDRRMASVAAASDGDAPVVKDANLAAQVLVDLVAGGRDSAGRNAPDGRRTASVLVVVDQETLVHGPHEHSIRQTEGGHDLASESIARLCCDAVARNVTLDATGVPINVGRKYRTATDAQWAAIKSIHSACAWDGCTAPIAWCQAHHILEWEHGGLTDLDNLVPLCSAHHHRVHEGQWSIKLLPHRSLRIHRPDGAHHATVPTPTRTQRC